jgi:hypothetical protein
MFEIIMVIDGTEYVYGRDDDRAKANEIAMQVRDERGVEVYVRGVEK